MAVFGALSGCRRLLSPVAIAYLAALHLVWLQRQIMHGVVLRVCWASKPGARPADGADVAAVCGLQQ